MATERSPRKKRAPKPPPPVRHPAAQKHSASKKIMPKKIALLAAGLIIAMVAGFFASNVFLKSRVVRALDEAMPFAYETRTLGFAPLRIAFTNVKAGNSLTFAEVSLTFADNYTLSGNLEDVTVRAEFQSTATHAIAPSDGAMLTFPAYEAFIAGYDFPVINAMAELQTAVDGLSSDTANQGAVIARVQNYTAGLNARMDESVAGAVRAYASAYVANENMAKADALHAELLAWRTVIAAIRPILGNADMRIDRATVQTPAFELAVANWGHAENEASVMVNGVPVPFVEGAYRITQTSEQASNTNSTVLLSAPNSEVRFNATSRARTASVAFNLAGYALTANLSTVWQGITPDYQNTERDVFRPDLWRGISAATHAAGEAYPSELAPIVNAAIAREQGYLRQAVRRHVRRTVNDQLYQLQSDIYRLAQAE